jgi:uncharacterized membrane protein (DUF106 family)
MLEALIIYSIIMIFATKSYRGKTFEQLTDAQKQKMTNLTERWNMRQRNAQNQRTVEQQLEIYQKQFKVYLIMLPILIAVYALAIYFVYRPYFA